MEVIYHVIQGFAQLAVQSDWVFAMDSSNKIGTLSNINLIITVPLYPLVILVYFFHFFKLSMACLICFS